MVWRYRPEPRRLHRRRRVATLPGADCLGELSRRDSRPRPRGCYWEPRCRMVWRYRPEPRRLHRRRRVATLPGADCLGELSRRDSRRRPRGCYWEPRALEIPQGSAEYIVAAVISRRDLSSARWSLYELEPREW